MNPGPGAAGLLWLWATVAEPGPGGHPGAAGPQAGQGTAACPADGQPTRARVAPESSRSRW
jgi:hypothetical protein